MSARPLEPPQSHWVQWPTRMAGRPHPFRTHSEFMVPFSVRVQYANFDPDPPTRRIAERFQGPELRSRPPRVPGHRPYPVSRRRGMVTRCAIGARRVIGGSSGWGRCHGQPRRPYPPAGLGMISPGRPRRSRGRSPAAGRRPRSWPGTRAPSRRGGGRRGRSGLRPRRAPGRSCASRGRP